MKIKDSTYFSVQAWMVNELNLKGAERDVYAIIYGYSQDGESYFYGSLEYLSQLTGYSRNAICTALKALTEKQLLIKSERMENNIKYCKYRTSSLYDRTSNLYSVQATCTENEQKEHDTVQVTLTNNKQGVIKKENNKINNKDIVEIQVFVNLYHDICNKLPRVKAITDKRSKAITKIIKKYSLEDIKTVFTNAQTSDFLTGKNDRGWKADIDFILREDKFISILEGKYNGKKQSVSAEGRLKLNRSVDKDKFWEEVKSGKAQKF